MKKIFIILLTSVCVWGCSKRTKCSGYVYSKYNFPIAGVPITLLEYQDSRNESRISVKATTDNKGHFSFKLWMKHNHQYAINCKSDSGNANAVYLENKNNNNINLIAGYK